MVSGRLFQQQGLQPDPGLSGKLHPLGRWYAVTQTYDGRFYRAYVDGVLQGEAEIPGFVPHGAGHTMIGTRMNHVNYFHGAIAQARFTDRALPPAQFLKVPETDCAAQ